MMRGGNREMRRMLDKMGLEMKDMGEIEEVVIRTETKELYLIKPQGSFNQRGGCCAGNAASERQ